MNRIQFVIVALFAILLPCNIVAAEYESKTITVFPADSFSETVENQNEISFSSQGFDFVASIGTSVDLPVLSKVQNFIRLFNENSLKISNSEGLNITEVKFNISAYRWGWDEISGMASGWLQNEDDLSVWTGNSPEFTMVVFYEYKNELNDDYELMEINYVNIESISITYLAEVQPEPEPEPEPEYGAVELAFTDLRVSNSGTTGLVSFTLNVANDDGVEKFTVTASDYETGAEYGRADFEPVAMEEPQGAPIMHVATADKSYSIRGTLPLEGYAADARPTLRLSAFATYPDGTKSHIDESNEPSISLPDPEGTTTINEVKATDGSTLEYYDLHGRRLLAPVHGVVIVKEGEKVTKRKL